jgi:UDP-N-acetylglucosamine:LPS N-acetylglucosamine transferase
MAYKKYLFIYLKTGGGHFAPANAVAKFLAKKENGAVQIKLVDGFEGSGRTVKIVVEDGYRILQNKAPWIYELIYAVHKFRIVSAISSFLVSLCIQKKLRKIILEEKPDKIVLFHFFAIAPVYKILRRGKIDIPVISVVTDPYSPHPIWFLRKEQTFIVFSDQLRNKCLKIGIDAGRIHVFPFIIDDRYSHRAPEREVEDFRNELGFSGRKLLLIMGGGDGIPKGVSILKAILREEGNYDIAMVCGRNKELYNRALRLKIKMKADRLKIYAYTDQIYKLISISDLIITKCGASTFMEILLSHKLPIVNSYIWEQEKGNVQFLVDNDIGIYEKRIGRLPGLVGRFFSDQGLFDRYMKNIDSLGFENGLAKVALFINDFHL